MSAVYFEITGKVKALTGKAVLFVFENNGDIEEKWIPRSVLNPYIEEFLDHNTTELEILEWFCNKEGIEG